MNRVVLKLVLSSSAALQLFSAPAFSRSNCGVSDLEKSFQKNYTQCLVDKIEPGKSGILDPLVSVTSPRGDLPKISAKVLTGRGSPIIKFYNSTTGDDLAVVPIFGIPGYDASTFKPEIDDQIRVSRGSYSYHQQDNCKINHDGNALLEKTVTRQSLDQPSPEIVVRLSAVTNADQSILVLKAFEFEPINDGETITLALKQRSEIKCRAASSVGASNSR